MTAPYENAEFIELGTIMPPEKFRTVLPEDRDAPGGLTEQKVVIEFRRDSPIYSQLLPCFRGAMFVYGFLRRGKGLRALFGDKYDEIKEKLKVSLHEWEDKFLLDFYVDDTYSKSYFVKSEEVLYLLQHCRNPQISLIEWEMKNGHRPLVTDARFVYIFYWSSLKCTGMPFR